MKSDPIHQMFLAQYQLFDIQTQTAHAFLDSKHVVRTDSQRQPYTLAQRIAKMVGDLPAEAVQQETESREDEVITPFNHSPNTYNGFNFSDS